MQVSPSQLVPGCVVVSDVKGKTGHPILPKDTTVSEKHITVLKKFLIPKVEVSSTLENGKLFKPAEPVAEDSPASLQEQSVKKEPGDFYSLYQRTVAEYKELFSRWQGNTAVDSTVVRNVIFPLLGSIEQAEPELLNLHQYADKNDYFYHHSVATAVLAAYIAKKNDYQDWKQVGLAGFLADCGMARIDTELFEKNAPLTSGEYEEMKKHPTYSYRLVEKIPSLPLKVKLGILQHHERMDGSGYPLGVNKDKLHPYATLIAVADVFHAMTSERYHQSKQSPYKVMEELLYEQFGKYDHMVVQTFINSLTNFSTGTKVKLSDKREAEIVFVDNKTPTRPLVRLADSMEIISLQEKKDLYIEAVI